MAAKADLSRAVGSVREGAIALGNLGQLLRSPRVGPRSLSRALPALQEAPGALAAAFATVERAARAVSDAGPEDEPAAILSGATRTLEELGAELAELRASIGARARLMLEARVRRVRQACAPALELCDALGHALEPRAALLDLSELLAQRWPPLAGDDRAQRGASGTRVAVSLGGAAPLSADPVLLLPLLEAMLRTVGEGGKATVTIEADAAGAAVLRVEAATSAEPIALLPAGPTGARALQVARLLARVAGLSLEESPGAVTLALP